MLTNSCKKKDKDEVKDTDTDTDTITTPFQIPNGAIIFNPDLTYGTVIDIDSNVYKTITIGTQTWMAENLKVTRYRNGDAIPNVTDTSAWNHITTGAYCDYNNTQSNSTIYGRLYNWYAVNDSRKIAPAGWHIPSDGEWNILEKYLDNTVDTTATGCVGTDIGKKLKEAGTTHWNSPNTGADNSSGFTALPSGGAHMSESPFLSICSYGYWWTASESYTNIALYRYLFYNSSTVARYNSYKIYGFSVRCLKD